MSTWGDLANQFNNAGNMQAQAYSSDPYAQPLANATSQIGMDSNQANAMQGQLQSQSMQMMGQLGQQQNSYPSYPNSAGAGSQMSGYNMNQMQSPPTQGTVGAPASQSINPYTASQGFNPWSMQGEAMSRVK